MTLLIVFLATSNIAIGYALAIYLGHGQLPWRQGAVSLRRSAASSPAREESIEPEELDMASEETHEEINEAVELPAKKSETASAEEDAEASIEDVLSKLSATVQAPETPEAPEAPVEVAPVEEVEAVVETKEEATATSNEETSEQPASEAPAEVSDRQEGTEEKLDEKFLEGIADFQSQLEQEDEKASEEEVVEASETAQEESSISDEVLAGIESFRDQLANMQQESGEEASESDAETSKKESAEQQPVA